MKKYNLILLVFLFICGVAFGQITTDEEPISFKKEKEVPVLKASEKSMKSLPSLDIKKIEQEDIDDEANGLPPRFGYRHKVNYDLENSGEWTDLSDGGKLWRLTIHSQGALSINLLYDKFWIPDGAKFFIYSADGKYSIGAVTSANNKGPKDDIQGFATGLVYGDQVTLEYYLPQEAEEVGVISIAYVVHGYRYIQLPNDSKSYGGSDTCQINVNCPEGANWQNEKNAIALILVNGNRHCTGSLINTTANDSRPLFLTANHCLGSWIPPDYNLSHWSFYWHYESPGCTSSSEPAILSTSGATITAYGVSDFALLKLTEDPADKAGVTPYYLGWDRSVNATAGGVGIHHPQGDIKKISVYNTMPEIVGANNTSWRAYWAQGKTQGGSSGSPLINNSGRVIGQLSGGSYDCGTPNVVYFSNYGRFSVSWTGDGATEPKYRLKDWLDPLNTGAVTVNGRGCSTTTLSNVGINNTQTVTGCRVVVNNVTFNSPANVTIAGDYRVVINSMVANEGSRVVIQAGGGTSQSSPSPSGDNFAVSDDLVSSRSLAEEPLVAAETASKLYQNIPNPFTGETVIGYYIPDTAHSAYLRFMTAAGVVAKAINISTFGEGEVSISANELSAGIYFYTLVVDGQIINSRQMIVGN